MESLIICPGCRRLDDALYLQTLTRSGDVLACECGRRYPIVDGVPIVLADPTNYVRTESTALLERDLPPETAALLVERGGDDAPYARLLEHVSVYMDAHWGDRADPPDGFALQPIIDRIADLPHVADTAELGCSAGRILAELARRSDHVIGVELQFATLRRARHLLAGESLPYNRRMVGRHYTSAVARGITSPNVQLVASDALDPPLVPAMYDRVVALNLLDSVHAPTTLLAVLDGLCAPGGEVILSSPFTWQTAVVDDSAHFGDSDPASALERWFTEKAYDLLDQGDVPWVLRRESRSATTYRTHYLRVRKPSSARSV